jgi:hypothetical protein
LSEPWEVPPKFEIADVGRLFIDTLEETPISNLVNGTVPFPKELTEAYKEVLNSILESKKPDDIPYDTDLLAPLNVIEAVVAHHIIAPLIKARLDTDHEVFHSIDKYIELLPTLPPVPVMLVGEDEVFADYMRSGTVGDAWTKYCLLTRAMHDTYMLNTGLHCFRSHELRKSKLNLCLQGGSCVGNIAAGQCEKWVPPTPLPNCVFASMVKRFGLTS